MRTGREAIKMIQRKRTRFWDSSFELVNYLLQDKLIKIFEYAVMKTFTLSFNCLKNNFEIDEKVCRENVDIFSRKDKWFLFRPIIVFDFSHVLRILFCCKNFLHFSLCRRIFCYCENFLLLQKSSPAMKMFFCCKNFFPLLVGYTNCYWQTMQNALW